MYSPNVSNIEVKTKGNVRRAKLYYLRKLTGRKAKITEEHTNKLKNTAKKEQEEIVDKKPKKIKKNIEKSKKKSTDKKKTKDNNKNKED